MPLLRRITASVMWYSHVSTCFVDVSLLVITLARFMQVTLQAVKLDCLKSMSADACYLSDIAGLDSWADTVLATCLASCQQHSRTATGIPCCLSLHAQTLLHLMQITESYLVVAGAFYRWEWGRPCYTELTRLAKTVWGKTGLDLNTFHNKISATCFKPEPEHTKSQQVSRMLITVITSWCACAVLLQLTNHFQHDFCELVSFVSVGLVTMYALWAHACEQLVHTWACYKRQLRHA